MDLSFNMFCNKPNFAINRFAIKWSYHIAELAATVPTIDKLLYIVSFSITICPRLIMSVPLIFKHPFLTISFTDIFMVDWLEITL